MADQIQRWMTPEGTFRILAARSTEMVSTAIEAAGCGPEMGSIYGRLLTGTALYQLAQAPIDRVQCSLQHEGTAGELLADVWPGPNVRGRIENAAPEQGPYVAGAVQISVTRRPARGGEPYTSVVPVKDGDVATAMQQYVLESEQVLTLFALEALITNDAPTVAGGMIVQALPGALKEHLEAITRCLEQASWSDLVRAGDDPIGATADLFSSLSLHEVGQDPLAYRCRCSRQAAVEAVRMLDVEELDELRKTGGHETVTCEFCRTEYLVAASDLDF